MDKDTFDIEEGKKTLAYLFKRKGTARLSKNTLLAFMVMDLKWLESEKVDIFIENCLKSKILVEVEPQVYSPNFNIAEVEFDLNFKPTDGIIRPYIPRSEVEGHDGSIVEPYKHSGIVLEENEVTEAVDAKNQIKKSDLYLRLINRITQVTKMKKTDTINEIEVIARKLNIYPEVAVALYARRFDIDLEDLMQDIENSVIDRARRDIGV